MVRALCRFDTLGKLVSAHHTGVGTTHVWCVTGARCVSGATSAADSVINLGGASPAPGASVIPMSEQYFFLATALNSFSFED